MAQNDNGCPKMESKVRGVSERLSNESGCQKKKRALTNERLLSKIMSNVPWCQKKNKVVKEFSLDVNGCQKMVLPVESGRQKPM